MSENYHVVDLVGEGSFGKVSQGKETRNAVGLAVQALTGLIYPGLLPQRPPSGTTFIFQVMWSGIPAP